MRAFFMSAQALPPKELPREGVAFCEDEWAVGGIVWSPGVFGSSEGAYAPLSPTGGLSSRRRLVVWSSPVVFGTAGHTFSSVRPVVRGHSRGSWHAGPSL